MAPNPPLYLMEDPREAGRLAGKVDPEQFTAAYLAPHLSGVQAALDVGCGPGVITRAVARACPGAEVIGLDGSPDRVARAAAGAADTPNVRFMEGSATELPFPDDAFDLIWCRFVLEYLPDPLRAVQEMARVCRPGGTVLLQDLDGQFVWHYPPDSELERQLAAVVAALGSTGFDPFIGRKLYTLAWHAGLKGVEARAESYHLFAGSMSERDLDYWNLKLDIALPTAARVLGGQDAAVALKGRFLHYLRRDDTLTYSVIFTVVGKKQAPA